MPWIQLKINTTSQLAEQISEQLEATGAVSVTFQDNQDTPVFEPLPGETPLWNNTDVIGLYNVDTDIDELKKRLNLAQYSYAITQLEDKNWEREWMDNFHPMQFGRRLWICPSWCDVREPDAVNVLLDPGLAFGTGTHPTTALCLTWLDNLDLQGKTIIDYGCGSGILAIAALKLGAKQAIGIDIDPQALQASRDNAERNQVNDKLTLYLAKDRPTDLVADVVVANILAGPLKELAPDITSLVKTEGDLGLSGILTDQAESVTLAYRPYFQLDPIATQEEWCRITGKRYAQSNPQHSDNN
ncbi:50S ribosomal protein L11 methyltransferase [Orbaceae bacterium ESL0727]|nr:50S ribosomal protein L11 methyltransferase [Orbaceae bacterium ESL0727]